MLYVILDTAKVLLSYKHLFIVYPVLCKKKNWLLSALYSFAHQMPLACNYVRTQLLLMNKILAIYQMHQFDAQLLSVARTTTDQIFFMWCNDVDTV